MHWHKSTGGRLSSDCRIMIVGGGPAGTSTWLHLQKYAPHLAERSILIEKAVFPRDKLCAGGLGGWGSDVLENLQVDLDIPNLPVSDVEFRFGEQVYHHHQAGCFKVIQRLDFDHALVHAAVKRGLQLQEGEVLIDVVRRPNGLLVQTAKDEYRVQVLVGADGAFSRVRRQMMPGQKSNLSAAIQIFAPVNPQFDPEFDEKKIVLDFSCAKDGLQGYVWHFPCLKQGVPSMAHGIGDTRIYPARPRANMKGLFGRELKSRNIDRDPAAWSSHPCRWLSSEAIISQPNVVLAGDAAGIEPALGGGIHLALAYGEVVSRAIIEAFQKADFSFSDYHNRVRNHLVGQSIRRHTLLARDLYGGRKSPLDALREFFAETYRPPDLLSLLLSKGPSF